MHLSFARQPLRSGVAGVALLLLSACSSSLLQGGDADASDGAASKTPLVASPAAAPLTRAQQELAAGVASYEDGAYKQSAKELQVALALGLESGPERARAHKYLAFMQCVNKRKKQCEDEFRKAIAEDPAFDLTAAEVGHPLWGPVYRKIKRPAAAK